MALQTSGAISFSDINIEIRRSSTATSSLGESAPRTTADKPASNEAISFSDFYGRTYGASVIFAGSALGGANTADRVAAWKWSQGFGTRYSAPATVPSGSGNYALTSTHNNTVIGVITNSATNRYTAFYPWSDASGFGTRYSLSGSFPATSPITNIGGDTAKFTPDGNAIIIGGSAPSPTTMAWAWTDASGFGTKFSDPATEPPDAFAIHIYGGVRGYSGSEGGGEAVMFGATSTDANRISAWDFNSSTGWGSKYSNPATMPLGSVYCFGSDIFAVIAGTNSSSTAERRSVAYDFSVGSGWSTKYSTMSATDIVGNPYGADLSWIRIGSFTAVISYATQSSPYIASFTFTSSGWGSKIANPGTLPTGPGNGLNWNLNLDVAVAHDVSPYITVYPLSGSGYGTKYSDPGTNVAGNIEAVLFSTNFVFP